MSLLKSQLSAASAHIAKCETIINTLPNADSQNYVLDGLKNNFSLIHNELKAIKPDIVEAIIRQHQSTLQVLDKHVNSANYQLNTTVIGVFVRLDNLNVHFSSKGDTTSVLKLEKVRIYSKKTSRVLFLMVHRKIAFLLSWRSVLLIVVVGLAAAIGTYVDYYAVRHTRSQTASESVRTHATSDAEKINTAARSRSIDETVKAVDSVLVELPKVPKAIIAITAMLTALQGLVVAIKKFSDRRSA